MKINLTPKNGIALLFLSFIMQETHELAHTGVGRIICGCWGKRNFNFWGLCKGCEDPLAILATYAGPLYSFAIIWFGYYFLTKQTSRQKSIGFTLVISTMPISRVITPLFGGGDEVYALNTHFNNHTISWITGLFIVCLAIIPPTIKAYLVIDNTRKILWFVSMLLIPFIMTGLVVFGLLQGLVLSNDILSAYWVLGSPMIITLWFLVCLLVLLFTGGSLKTILKD